LLSQLQHVTRSVRVLNEQAVDARAATAASLVRALQLDRLAEPVSRSVRRRPRPTGKGCDVLYVNSVSSLRLLRDSPRSIPVLLHVHELDFAVSRSVTSSQLPLGEQADAFLAVSDSVRDMLIERQGVPPERITRVHECLPDDELSRPPVSRNVARTDLGLDPRSNVVVGCGTLEWRKGDDLFIATAVRHAKAFPNERVNWIWVGGTDEPAAEVFLREIDKAGLAGRVTYVASTADVHRWIAAADVLLMSSREDPYPLVVLEAALAGRPVVCQAGAGGAAEFVARGSGMTCSYLDIDGMAKAVHTLLSDPSAAHELGVVGRRLVLAEHGVSSVALAVLQQLDSLVHGSSC
jgi:glycosyltransferase involved in cell wall biosynthesis